MRGATLSCLLTLPGAVLAIGVSTLVPSQAQAPGVPIAEQSRKGRGQVDAAISEKVAALEADRKLLDHKTIERQMEKPLPYRLELPSRLELPLSPSIIAEKARASAFRVGWAYLCNRCGDWHLSLAGGYAITQDGAIATCAHVLKAPKMKRGSLIVADRKGNVYPVTGVLAYDREMDAAIIKVEQELTPLPFNDEIRPGDEAFCFSDPLGQRGYFSRGMVNRFYWDDVDRGKDDSSIEALRRLKLNVSTSWAPGSSGSPVLDHCGNAIGHVALIQALAEHPPKGDDPDKEATISDVKGSVPLITLHAAIPARSVQALALAVARPPSSIVPAPLREEISFGSAIIGSGILGSVPEFKDQVEVFVKALQKLGVPGAVATANEAGVHVIAFAKDESLVREGYAIAVSGGRLKVTASSSAGAAYAIATLLQSVTVKDGEAHWPRLNVVDRPDNAYRSFMIDMGRNPHSPKTVLHVVDMMWFYKANYLHLHLTDDQLFSWPSTAYPDLHSERAGWTLEDFMALEAYSQARGVTVVPEIDVPGHSTILRREYPEVFGETSSDLANSPAAQKGVETLIAELLSVFKATPYIHLGGDEAGGVTADDQRDFINRLNAFIKLQGKRTIVWEGPGLGEAPHKVDEDVIHMNWNTVNFPAQEMLDAGYEVINAAWDPLYVVDHYPRTMFTGVEVERCYNWNGQRFGHIDHGMPTFAKAHLTKTARGIVGFCMPWWEGREENILPLCVERFAAVASAAWNREGENDFEAYQTRQKETLPILETVSGFQLPSMPFADPETQQDNHAYKAKVTPSAGASQPHFCPARLTNGIPDSFDHFLGFPTQPDPLEILIELVEPAEVGRVVIYERAVGESYELYELHVSLDGETFEKVGAAEEGTRGAENHIEHTFDAREVHSIKIITQGCHGLTFPSFSRLSEVMAFTE